MSWVLEVLGHAGPLLTLAVVILVGVLFGALARRIGLPGVTGQILAGVLMGEAGFSLFDPNALEGLAPLTHLALGLIAVTVGAHLNLQRLRNAGRRLFLLLLAESIVTPVVVFLALFWLPGSSAQLALLLATVAIATAPATALAIVKETRSKGVFVKTLIAAVALNNMACIVLFEIARGVGSSLPGGASPGSSLAEGALTELLIAVAIGGIAALAMDQFARLTARPDRMATAAVVALVFTSGLASTLDVSPLLACLVLGLVQTNVTRARSHLVDSVFADFEPTILAIFFTLAGMHLTMVHLEQAGLIAAFYLLARGAGKFLAARLAMGLAGATESVRRNLGLALLPQAGVAVGLVIVIQNDPGYAHLAGLMSAVVLSVVTVNEIIGPLLTRRSLALAGEIGMDRLRLMDFLQEENIVTDFRAGNKREAILSLSELLIRSHGLHEIDRESLIQSILDREGQASTCLGGGLSVPHGILPAGFTMVGVMALSRQGLDFDTPDGQPVHCMVLLGTSPEERERHLQVLATLARTIGLGTPFQEQLFNASSAAHASEILHGEESEDFNYFLETPNDAAASS
jgi:Kef-type K+ transport system membrane component KefB/mannitol/fructose-specific phosphotransferase system IIA component (Ntr-type)